jgi:rubrerythrin
MEIIDSTTYIKIETKSGQIYSFFPLKRQWRKFGKDTLKTEKFYDILNQAKMYKESEQVRSKKDEKEKIKKIKTMLSVSNRLKLKMIRIALGLDKESFNGQIFDWAKEFEFTIDGEYLIVNKDTSAAFLHHLESLENGNRDYVKDSKFECSFCGNVIDFKAEACPYCGNKN